MSREISIIICTRNRAQSLRATLDAISRLHLPGNLRASLIVVDNGSTDDTPDVLRRIQGRGGNLPISALHVSEPGKSRALNQAVAAARGDVLLFTDDDVRPPLGWIEQMSRPILEGSADAVAGGVRLADHLKAPWLGAEQRAWLASTEDVPRGEFHPLIGANMAVARHVFSRIPGFDPEVGPGATGHAEDTLFWLQMRAAGYRVVARLDVEVEHHLEPERRFRKAFVRQARKRGEFAAYVEHHWEGFERRHPYLGLTAAALKLGLARLRHLPSWLRCPTMPAWELGLLENYHMRRRLLVERRRPRNYERQGLVKRSAVSLGRPSRQEPVPSPVLEA